MSFRVSQRIFCGCNDQAAHTHLRCSCGWDGVVPMPCTVEECEAAAAAHKATHRVTDVTDVTDIRGDGERFPVADVADA